MNNAIDYSKYFKNYNFINDYCFNKDDYISEMLVKNYQTSIYNVDINNSTEVKNLKKIDQIMRVYIVDTDFFQLIQKKLTSIEDNFVQDLNIILVEEYRKFENDVGIVPTSRWI